jgi:hypothetical protein
MKSGVLRARATNQMKPQIETIATILEHREIYDHPATLQDLVSLILELNLVDSARLFCQMNADFRLTKREREAVGKTQQDIAGGLLSDETIGRLKARFGRSHMADRPIFYPAQILNVFQLMLNHSKGPRSPLTDESSRHALGNACLMMSDLMMTDGERRSVASGDREGISRALMAQMLGPFELQNPASIAHVIYRSRIMFRELLGRQAIRDRIRKQCQGFDFENEFLRVAGVPLSKWLVLIQAFYAYLAHYRDQEGGRHPEFLAIDRLQFGKDTPIPQTDLDAALRSVSSTVEGLRDSLKSAGAGDWRFDSVPFRSKPLIQLQPDKFYCLDLGLLVEKIHTGVFWTIHDGLTRAESQNLSIAWGILFEEYVNWFLAGRPIGDHSFWPAPQWSLGGECLDGAFMKGCVFMPMEYKGGFLLREARYAGSSILLEAELETKIAKGCKQIARKIESLFNRQPNYRRLLRDIPLDHITRIVPVLVVQDPILGGPLLNWRINKSFNEILDRTQVRPDVTVDALNVVGIRELETMAESAESGGFDLFGGLQLRCYADPEMRSNLHNFLLDVPGYGEGKSVRIDSILESQFAEALTYLFGKSE